MNYQQFLETIKIKVTGLLGPEMRVKIKSTTKNNNTVHYGITIRKEGQKTVPTIYLEEYFERYQAGEAIDDLVEDLLLFNVSIQIPNMNPEELLCDFSKCETKVMYRLINPLANQAMLTKIPHRIWNNLAVVYYVLVEVQEKGCITMPINTEHTAMWGVTEEQLFELANTNTVRSLPYHLLNMFDLVSVLFDDLELPPNGRSQGLYKLSNIYNNFGAACILYQGIFSEIREKLGQDFYILPSSVHEVMILLADHVAEDEDLSEMVDEINQISVASEEVLSTQIYFYSLEEGLTLC